MKRRNRSKLAENTREASPGKGVPAGGGRSAQASSGWMIVLAASLIVLAAVAAYHNSFAGPFILDDHHLDCGEPEHSASLADLAGAVSVQRRRSAAGPWLA